MDVDLNRRLAKELREHLEYGWSAGIRRAWKAIFFSRLGDALNGSEEELRHINSALADVFRAWINEIDGELKVLVTGGSIEEKSPISQALMLGQLMVAQGLASQALRSRIDAPMLEAVERFKKYLLPLKSREMSNKALADYFGESTAHVTRQLSEMRRAGLVDFRRESKNTINFLTGSAKEALINVATDDREDVGNGKDTRLPISIIFGTVKGLHPERKGGGRSGSLSGVNSRHYPGHASDVSPRDRAFHKMLKSVPEEFVKLPIFSQGH